MPRSVLSACLMSIALFATHPALAVEIILGPTLTLNPNGLTPLSASLELFTDVPTVLTLTVDDGQEVQAIRFSTPATAHVAPLLGLRPDSAYTVTVTVTDDVGNSVDAPSPLGVNTAPLPFDFPVLTVLSHVPESMEPGYVLLDKISRTPGDSATEYSMILNRAAEVVWYSTLGNTPMNQRDDGRLTYLVRGQDEKQAIDLLGNVESVNLQDPGLGLHHELHATSLGTYLSLTQETFIVPDFPASYTDPDLTQNVAVRDTPVVEFDAAGTLLNIWRLRDMLDIHRIGYGSLTANANGRDWIHANAAWYHPEDDSITVSLRHQDAIVKFAHATGELIWILAPHANWSEAYQPHLLTPVGTPFEWAYHQHSHMPTPDGTLLLFDNGNDRTSPYDGNPRVPSDQAYSRAVEFLIDEELMTVTQVWEWQPEFGDRLYSPAASDADWMALTGNVLVHFRGVTHEGGVEVDQHARVVEVTRDDPATVVFEVTVSDPGQRIRISRAEKIASLYAADVGVCGNDIVDPIEDCDPPGPAGIRRVCLPDCRLDEDGDGIADDDDPCVFSPNPEGGTAVFGQSILARGAKDGFDWPFHADAEWARGEFTTSSDIGAFFADAGGTVSGRTLIDPALPAIPGSGLWYLTRPDCIDSSWTSGGPAEVAGRDASLP